MDRLATLIMQLPVIRTENEKEKEDRTDIFSAYYVQGIFHALNHLIQWLNVGYVGIISSEQEKEAWIA